MVDPNKAPNPVRFDSINVWPPECNFDKRAVLVESVRIRSDCCRTKRSCLAVLLFPAITRENASAFLASSSLCKASQTATTSARS